MTHTPNTPQTSTPVPHAWPASPALFPTLVMSVSHRWPSESAPSCLSIPLAPRSLERITRVAQAATSLEGEGERIHVIDLDWFSLQCGQEQVQSGLLIRDGQVLHTTRIFDEHRNLHNRTPRSGPSLPYSFCVLAPAGFTPEFGHDRDWQKGKSGLRITANTLCLYAWDRYSDVRVISERLHLRDLLCALQRNLKPHSPASPS